MKIVVIDGEFVNPGDLSWYKISTLGNFQDFPEESEAARQAAYQADVLLTNKFEVDKEFLEQTKNLKFIGEMATGYNNIDIKACSEKGIVVSNCPGYGTDIVAQYTFAMILALVHKVEEHSQSVLRGEWDNKGFSYYLNKPFLLKGKTLGIIGYGSIGQRVKEIAETFGMKALACDIVVRELYQVSLEEVLMMSDIISLHANLTEENHGMINRETISKMKHGVFLINVARGSLINEEDLKEALNSGKIAGAAVDTVTEEPITRDNPLLQAKNIIITPHIAWVAKEARQEIMDITYENIKAFKKGRPQNRIEVEK